jgi:hypothetical protein
MVSFKFLHDFLDLMSSALENNTPRKKLPDRLVQMETRPQCPHCHRSMAIAKTAATRLIGKEGNYTVLIVYYRCKHYGCLGNHDAWIHVPNPYTGLNMSYDYEVQAEVCLIRWQEHATYEEIVERMKKRYDIAMDKTAVELFLKSYEIGCAKEYREQFLAQIHDNGGIFLCIDVIEPLQGKDGFLVGYDYWTGLALGSYRMPNAKQVTYEGILGIISDALKEQREAIALVFPEVPHCLCHYHFFNLVLKSAKQLDSAVVTQLREALRKLYDLKQYAYKTHSDQVESSQYAKLAKILAPLLELSNWKRKPKDPCFIGIELFQRISDLKSKFHALQIHLETKKIGFPGRSVKVLIRIQENLTNLLIDAEPKVAELRKIREPLKTLAEILDKAEQPAEQGLDALMQFCENLHPYRTSLSDNCVEAQVIDALLKFVDTKGELLFNYRKIEEAPRTNNALELRFKQLKHLLRRTLGYGAAKEYLAMHGERIFFIDPKEPFDRIVKILSKMDQVSARNQIRSDRNNRDRLGIIIHDHVRWQNLLAELDHYIVTLE